MESVLVTLCTYSCILILPFAKQSPRVSLPICCWCCVVNFPLSPPVPQVHQHPVILRMRAQGGSLFTINLPGEAQGMLQEVVLLEHWIPAALPGMVLPGALRKHAEADSQITQHWVVLHWGWFVPKNRVTWECHSMSLWMGGPPKLSLWSVLPLCNWINCMMRANSTVSLLQVHGETWGAEGRLRTLATLAPRQREQLLCVWLGHVNLQKPIPQGVFPICYGVMRHIVMTSMCQRQPL